MNRYLTWREVTSRLGVSKQSVWRWVAAGRFPAPVRLGPGRVAFRECDIIEWEASREEVRYGGARSVRP